MASENGDYTVMLADFPSPPETSDSGEGGRGSRLAPDAIEPDDGFGFEDLVITDIENVAFGEIEGGQSFSPRSRSPDGDSTGASLRLHYGFELSATRRKGFHQRVCTSGLHDYESRNAIDQPRSEERRVGKECRSRWSTYH